MTRRPACLLPVALAVGCVPIGPGRARVNTEPASCVDEAGWGDGGDLDGFITGRMAEGRLPGLAVCVVEAGETVACGAYGTLRGGGGGLVSGDTPFLLASVSKLATATAILQLAESGQLDLDQDLAEILPFDLFHPIATTAPITTRQVLAHVSGLADNDPVMDQWVGRDEDPALDLSDIVPAYFSTSGQHYDPQRNFTGNGPQDVSEYSNMGYALLGYVVEVVSGEGFVPYSEAEIFAPLGMDDTAWRLADLDVSTLAEPTLWQGGGWQPQGHTTFADYPNGGLRSSACDQAAFLGAMQTGGGGVLGAEALAAAQAVAYPGLDDRQGLGWYGEDLGEDALWVGHSGGEAGVATDVFTRQDGSLGVVLLANGDWGNEAAILDIEDAVIAWATAR